MSGYDCTTTPTCSNRCAVTVKSDTTNSTPTLEPLNDDVDEVESMGFNELASFPTPVVVLVLVSFVMVLLVVALLMLALVTLVRVPGVVINTLEARRVSGPTTKRWDSFRDACSLRC